MSSPTGCMCCRTGGSSNRVTSRWRSNSNGAATARLATRHDAGKRLQMSAVVDFPVKPEARPYLDAALAACRRARLARAPPPAQPRPLCRARLSEPPRRSLALPRSAPARTIAPASDPDAMRRRIAERSSTRSASPAAIIAWCWSMGGLSPELSAIEGLPAGVWFGSTAAAIDARPELVRDGARSAVARPRSAFRRAQRRLFQRWLCPRCRARRRSRPADRDHPSGFRRGFRLRCTPAASSRSARKAASA